MTTPIYQLLVVDDDNLVIQSLRMALPSNWKLTGVNTLKEVNPTFMFHACFTDMHLTGNLQEADGLKVIEKVVSENPQIEIVAMSGDLSMELMESCLKRGAHRFLAKPLHVDEVLDNLAKIEALWQLRQYAQSSRTVSWRGASPAAQEVKKNVAAMRGESGPILIEGESGTGKEVIANIIHSQENRGPLIAINLAAISENLFESEFFGHVKGAFTGADQNKIGLTEAAHGGDLFLDEVEALPLHFQVKLLRFLETGEVKKVGSKEVINVKTRVIVATNQNLNQLVKEGKFREDLLWRMNGKKILLPPLRDRKSDIPELAEYFLSLEKRRNKKFAPDALEALKNYSWPGNVRELKRVCEQLILVSPLPIIRAQDVNSILKPSISVASATEEIDYSLGLSETVNRFEAQVLKSCLEKVPDIDEAARVLQISRSSLYKKIKDYNIDFKGS